MLSNERDAKTYQDLMGLLPDVSKITLWWTPDEDGFPRFIDRAAFHGHNNELLTEVDADGVEDLPGFEFDASNTFDVELRDRILAALMVLSWLDASTLEEAGAGATVVILPSASHVTGALPPEWSQQ